MQNIVDNMRKNNQKKIIKIIADSLLSGEPKRSCTKDVEEEVDDDENAHRRRKSAVARQS